MHASNDDDLSKEPHFITRLNEIRVGQDFQMLGREKQMLSMLFCAFGEGPLTLGMSTDCLGEFYRCCFPMLCSIEKQCIFAENHLRILLQKTDLQLPVLDMLTGWQSLIVLSGGLCTDLGNVAHQLLARVLNRREHLQDPQTSEGLTAGCSHLWGFCSRLMEAGNVQVFTI